MSPVDYGPEYDVIVVGASFAGLVFARAAALRGLSTLVLERKREVGMGVRTTGLIVREAAEAFDLPAALTRKIRRVRVYRPRGQAMEIASTRGYVLASDTPRLLRWFRTEAERAGATVRTGEAFLGFARAADGVVVNGRHRGRFLVGADGAFSPVARAAGLSRNQALLHGAEWELAPDDRVPAGALHCLVDPATAPGYLAWVFHGFDRIQAGVAARAPGRPDMAALARWLEERFGLERPVPLGRRGGAIPCGGPLARTGDERVLLIGDAAGHVSPLTAGGIRLSFSLGRRAAAHVADWLEGGVVRPDRALARDLPRLWHKRLARWVYERRWPDWLLDAGLAGARITGLAHRIYLDASPDAPRPEGAGAEALRGEHEP